jgi:hypothetical protein
MLENPVSIDKMSGTLNPYFSNTLSERDGGCWQTDVFWQGDDPKFVS